MAISLQFTGISFHTDRSLPEFKLFRSPKPLSVRCSATGESSPSFSSSSSVAIGSDFDAKTFRHNLVRSDNYNRRGFGHKKETLELMNQEYTTKKASRNHSNTTMFGQSKSNAVTHCSFSTKIHPKIPMMTMEHKIAVKICALRRRRSNTGTDTYVLMEPGKEEIFVTEDELREKLKGWLDNWPGEALPLDLARFDNTDDAVSYLVTSVCELEIDGDVGSIQWYEVRLE